MNLLDKLGSAAKGLVLSTALAVSGCGFNVGSRDTVFTGGLIGGGMEIVNKVYNDDEHTNLSAVYSLKIDILGEKVNMNIGGSNGEKRWGYQTSFSKDGKNRFGSDSYRPGVTEIFDAKGQKVNEFPGVPRSFPTGVNADTRSEKVKYTNFLENSVSVDILSDKETIDFYVRDRKKPDSRDVITSVKD
ncbi:MAG: hypothetical protein WCP89_01740 [archaeon]